MSNMIIKRPAGNEEALLVDEDVVLSFFNDFLVFLRKENPSIVIFHLIYTVNATHKIDMHYALRGEHEISPMGFVQHEYDSLDQFRDCIHDDFSGLEFPD